MIKQGNKFHLTISSGAIRILDSSRVVCTNLVI